MHYKTVNTWDSILGDLLTAEINELSIAVPPPNMIDRAAVAILNIKLMLPFRTSHTFSRTCSVNTCTLLYL